jgi:hypothetical protein
MILTNSNRFQCLKFSDLIYLWLVFIYDFDKLKPFLVPEIQLRNLYMILTNSNRFIVWNAATLFISRWYIYIWQSETSVSHISTNTENMHFSINGFRMVSRLDKNAVFESLKKK